MRYGDICICVADLLCYKAETNTPLLSNYTPIKMLTKRRVNAYVILLDIIKFLSWGILHFLAIIKLYKDAWSFIDLTTECGFNLLDFLVVEKEYVSGVLIFISLYQWGWTSFLRVESFAFSSLFILCTVFYFIKK